MNGIFILTLEILQGKEISIRFCGNWPFFFLDSKDRVEFHSIQSLRGFQDRGDKARILSGARGFALKHVRLIGARKTRDSSTLYGLFEFNLLLTCATRRNDRSTYASSALLRVGSTSFLAPLGGIVDEHTDLVRRMQPHRSRKLGRDFTCLRVWTFKKRPRLKNGHRFRETRAFLSLNRRLTVLFVFPSWWKLVPTSTRPWNIASHVYVSNYALDGARNRARKKKRKERQTIHTETLNRRRGE